jgi:hypothetical protein
MPDVLTSYYSVLRRGTRHSVGGGSRVAWESIHPRSSVSPHPYRLQAAIRSLARAATGGSRSGGAGGRPCRVRRALRFLLLLAFAGQHWMAAGGTVAALFFPLSDSAGI